MIIFNLLNRRLSMERDNIGNGRRISGIGIQVEDAEDCVVLPMP